MLDLDWTHKDVLITDIRKLNRFYIISTNATEDGEEIPSMLIKYNIFEERLKSYFLTENYTREMVLGVKWNMYLTKGHFIKIDENGHAETYVHQDKWYVSYLEIAGPLGTFSSVYKKEKLPETK